MFALLAAVAFVIGLIVHEVGERFLTDAAGWVLVGLIMLSVAHVWPVALPWRNRTVAS